MKKAFLSVLFCFFMIVIHAQTVVSYPKLVPEHGYLPGKKFKFYPTINNYDFKGLRMRVELHDDRPTLRLTKTDCSGIPFTKTSEFESPRFVYRIREYIDTLFRHASIIVDTTSQNVLEARLEGLDARLFGFGYVRVHGLCQMKLKYHNYVKTYCVDITDADKHSPVGPNALVTRKTATRILVSAAIREVLEQFLIDLQNYN